jgi:glyoxylase-like metal-dependent hydrolase (beta-lactamase superfamily II)
MSNATSHSISLGDATITIINVGDMMVDMAQEITAPESAWLPLYGASFAGSRPYPSQCAHIALPNASILVDAGDYAQAISLDPSYLPPAYVPPPGLVEQLLSQGIRPDDITHLIITHAHFDHYDGTTIEREDGYVPRFPNARVFLGRADWDNPETQDALRDPDSLESHTFGVLHEQGLLEPVEGDIDVTPEVRIIRAPGESPGHQIVRVHSQGHTFYCLGDLFHHPAEVEHPAWMVKWADAPSNLSNRQALIKAALQENALLLAAHMPVGRIEGTLSYPRWLSLLPR